jgi:hypothetical protein
MARSNSRFRAPTWLRCVACVAGMAPLFPALLAQLRVSSIPNALSLMTSIFLFRFCLHTLVTGSPPTSVSSLAANLRQGKLAVKEKQRAQE